MKTSKLPPELVEKMLSETRVIQDQNSGISPHELSEKCAQIAVDYTEEKVRLRDESLSVLSENSVRYKQQRDELLEVLKSKYYYLEEIAMLIPSDNWTEQFRTKWNSEMTNLEQLINRIDGK